MKKAILTLLVSILAVGMAFGEGPINREKRGPNSAQWKQMDKWHDVMHGLSVQAKEIKDGIELQVAAESKEFKETLKNDFKFNPETLSTFFKGAEVALNETDKGFDIKMTSKDAEIVKDLQYWRGRVLYQYFRNQMHREAFGSDGKYGHMGGCGGGQGGHGPGMMHGGWGRGGYGPGMMGGNYGPMGSRPMMEGNSNSEI